MYESPIKINYGDPEFQTIRGLRDKTDQTILYAVMDAGIRVDKEELEKALQYDRDQYEEGFRDGEEAKAVIARWIRHRTTIMCSNCRRTFSDEVTCCEDFGWYWEHCPKCGATMERVIDDA